MGAGRRCDALQRANFSNSDASEVRREFQKAAATALANGKAKP
jgi:hypothetical protein